ncbi:VOC family protein [Pedobacter punctiformis]|uniref:VOC family protein n=1 Tax=Pedobacter punctiformis TaxID=3004097 RepID=A0ABT4L4C0_9SPHI|nr:VOC family protein [Pedobacter sp. HCMS5-2]MCZ4242666.1 VOC family protein [Pedobacter sp. HCMS5-2]
MKKTALIILGFAAAFSLGFFFKTIFNKQTTNHIDVKQVDNVKIKQEKNMKLGAFSISLSVKDLNVSKQFYENLGFVVFAGGMEKNYLIMKNENALVGLFQGMFKGNILTFNPGWDENANNIEKFDDVREIQKQLKSKGLTVNPEADEQTTGPASLMVTDPDGNVVLIDQHR